MSLGTLRFMERDLTCSLKRGTFLLPNFCIGHKSFITIQLMGLMLLAWEVLENWYIYQYVELVGECYLHLNPLVVQHTITKYLIWLHEPKILLMSIHECTMDWHVCDQQLCVPKKNSQLSFLGPAGVKNKKIFMHSH